MMSIGVDARGEALVTGLRKGFYSVEDGAQNTAAAPSLIRRQSRSRASLGSEEGLTLNLVGANQVNLETDYLVLASTNVIPDLMGLDDPSVGLEVSEGGIAVNASLEAYHGLFVAGNAATYYDVAIGRRRVDTYDHAFASGMWAAHNMIANEGKVEQYSHQPCFKSTLAGIGINFIAVGKIDARLQTVGVWFRPEYEGSVAGSETSISVTPPSVIEEATLSYRRGVLYYIEKGRVVGILLCNAPEMLERAREVLRTHKILTDPGNELPKYILLAPNHWLHVISTDRKSVV